MSQTATLPDAQAASQTLHDIRYQVFFSKLASAGIAPQTQQQAHSLLQLADRLRQMPAEKEANDPYAEALQALDRVMPPQQAAQPWETDMAIKSAAAQLSADPSYFNAVLALKQAQLQQAG